ncbi:Phosphoenolpyruvate/pyruvate domain-containing protein [Martensiomyces pterosporus]|nr:Phosphoenolpyruvate/pyruvate domain-containing protein [Martensiomyces pterosporus]
MVLASGWENRHKALVGVWKASSSADASFASKLLYSCLCTIDYSLLQMLALTSKRLAGTARLGQALLASAHAIPSARRGKATASATTLSDASAPVPGLDLGSERLRRTVFYVPCSEERKIQKSLASKADCVMYDLEDGVSLNRKGLARELVLNALAVNTNKTELGVRINSVGSGLELDDLNVVLRSDKLNTILVPKVESPKDIHVVSHLIESIAPAETRPNIKIIAGIESALGLMNIRDIATANDRVDALLFAAEDYCSDTGITRTPSRKELYYARSVVATAAHAFKLQAIDMVCMDFKNMDVLKEECTEGAQMGFTGKQVIHPAQVDAVQEHFLPPEDIVFRAWRIVKGYQKHYELGKGAFDLDGKAIDMPVVKWAYKILRRVELAGVDLAAKYSDTAGL